MDTIAVNWWVFGLMLMGVELLMGVSVLYLLMLGACALLVGTGVWLMHQVGVAVGNDTMWMWSMSAYALMGSVGVWMSYWYKKTVQWQGVRLRRQALLERMGSNGAAVVGATQGAVEQKVDELLSAGKGQMDMFMDVGAIVLVQEELPSEGASSGQLWTQYRGARWSVRTVDGSVKRAGYYTIVAVDGNTLLI